MKKVGLRNRTILGLMLAFIFLLIYFFPSKTQIRFVQASESTEETNPKYFEGYGKYAEAGEPNADSKNATYAEEIHEATRLMSASDDSPSITVLVHGQGGDASAWSNNGNSKFTYDSSSLIEILRSKASNADIYWAKMSKKNYDGKDYIFDEVIYQRNRFFLIKLNEGNYNTVNNIENTQFVTRLTEIGKHIIIVFESAMSDSYHRDVYQELHSVVDRVSYDILCLTGRIPKVNFISHSRGGIISMLYATGYMEEGRIEKINYTKDSSNKLLQDLNCYQSTGQIINDHPFNVASLYSMGTPYIGTQLSFIKDLNFSKLEDLFGTNIDISELNGIFENESAQNILDEIIQQEIQTCWERAVSINNNLKLNAIIGEMDISFLPGLLAEEGSLLGELLISYGIFNNFNQTVEYYIKLIREYINQITDFIETAQLTILESSTNELRYKNYIFYFTSSLALIGILETAQNKIDNILSLVDDIENSTQGETDYDDQTLFTIFAEVLKKPLEDLCKVLNKLIGYFECDKNFNLLFELGDMFIDSHSQSAMGYSNVQNYKKIFKYPILEFEAVDGQYRLTEESVSNKNFDYKKTVNHVGIPHNLETRDSEIINYIKEDIELAPPAKIYSCFADSNGWSISSSNYNKYNSSYNFKFVIPEKISDINVIKIGNSAFENTQNLFSLKILSNIENIGKKAFYGSELCDITFESGSRLQTIGESAFENCEMLGWVKGIELPASLENIGSRAFYSCNKLAKVVFANKSKLTSIGKNAFYNCAELAEVYIPANTTVIEDCAFYNCTNLRKIYFEKESKLINIGEKVFSYCTGLNKIEIPASVKELKFGAFYGCSALTDVTFEENSNLTTINSMAFYGCSSLNYNKEVPFEIPSKVTFIGDYAFSGCTSLRSITVPYMLNHLGNYAFANCTKLNVISIFSNLSFIGEGVFSGWTSNQTIHMVGIESVLSGWSNLWHSECHAEIIWDADEIVTEL